MVMIVIKLFAMILSVPFLLSAAACPADNSGYPTDGNNTSTGEGRQLTDGSNSPSGDGDIVNVPDEIAEIPDEYYSPAEEKGTLVELYYDTYESMTYEQHTTPLHKRAIVYLPYGYTDETEYHVFYLMHGGWGNETTTLGTPDHPSRFKNVIDNAIQDGKFDRLIIVCPTYNNTNENGQDSANFSLALQLNRNHHNELINDLIPAVESKYHTCAGDVTAEGIAASRDHRGFGGFSMGAVATWRTFQNGLDYFRYFLPMSCGTGLDDDTIFEAANGREQSDYFVFIMTGTRDFAYSYDNNRVAKMRTSAYFTEAKDGVHGNFAYRVKEGYSHGGVAAIEYTYNGLMLFGGNRKAAASSDFTVNTKIADVISDDAFSDWGRLIFPTDTGYYSGATLGELRMTWYTGIDADKTVEIANYMKSHAAAGETVFYDIYTDAEKAADPAKEDTGLFFFRGNAGARFAVCNAGGGFAYVGAMHDSFPHALELSKKGYHAFALIYRPGATTACEDLARAISFIFENANGLGVNTDCYSLWGGSAGARMAANLGSYGTAYYGGDDLPRAGAVIMQYTGHSDYRESDPPTFACVGKNDGIANWQTMKTRIDAMSALGIPTEFHAYEGLGHGFGLGTGTDAEGWLDLAVRFWRRHMSE
jgi:enterochelin esterase-like enzyme/acetyl esterase/lipase